MAVISGDQNMTDMKKYQCQVGDQWKCGCRRSEMSSSQEGLCNMAIDCEYELPPTRLKMYGLPVCMFLTFCNSIK